MSTTSEGDNDIPGTIRFKGQNDASEETEFATIYARNIDVSDGTEDGELHFRTIAAGSLDTSMIIKSGNVGIGTASPGALLHVAGGHILIDNAQEYRIKNNAGTIKTVMRATSGDILQLGWSGGDTTIQGSSYAERVRFKADGKVGIGTDSPDFKLQVDGTIAPESDDSSNLGSASLRWADVFAVQTTTGGVFETGLKTEKIGDNPTGTIVSWKEDGLVPCDKNEDELVMGVIKKGKDEPIVLGAEPVLVTGKVNVGDYIVTSDKIGHGKSVKRGYLLKKNLFGKVIAQALESCDGDSNLIKCMIRKM